MSFQFFSFLSGLAYLSLCLLIAASRARKKCLRDAPDFSAPTTPFTVEQTGQRVAENGRPSSVLLPLSSLISLSAFLFMPCGTLPSSIPFSGGALIIVGILVVAPGFWGGRQGVRRQGAAPFCLGVALAAMAWYARQRGVPGDLTTLDAYVAMPIVGAAEGTAKFGVCVLAAVSLFVLRKVWPTRQSGKNLLHADTALLTALAAELWTLAAIGFWVCLFFPFSFTFDRASGISVLGGLALNALFFWAKLSGLAWLLEKR
ncbi:MAG: hypothetical protein LBU43_09295 [Candidatus Accumulibacter sp.]|jgi:hypothetical protein|nr:hypothetical protein [Accumulibacter sp.]